MEQGNKINNIQASNKSAGNKSSPNEFEAGSKEGIQLNCLTDRQDYLKSKVRFWRILSFVFISTTVFLLALGADVNVKYHFALPWFGAQKVLEQDSSQRQDDDSFGLREKVIPTKGVALPVKWGSLGKQMVEAGVIDKEKLEALYAGRGGLDSAAKNLLYGENNGNLHISTKNSGLILNLLWAFGLGNKNRILEEGPMQDKRYGSAGRFASTGGWTLAKGNVMDHYSRHRFLLLNHEQQSLVELVARNIYRPCCGNSTYFPDCNHGMAMLGLLELLAAQGASEEQMYKTALRVNAYWFPETYLTIAKYFEKRGVDWSELKAKDILGSAYSSALGYRQILKEVRPVRSSGGGGCGV